VMVTLVSTDACGVCGYIRTAFMFPTMRVNKRSMRSHGTHLALGFGRCRECGAVTGAPPSTRWLLDPKSAAEVEAYRLKLWPELAGELAA